MANRFKSNHDAVDFTDPSALTVVPAEVQTPPIEETAPAQQPNDIIADLAPEVKPKAKSYGFYLDDDVVKALDRLAKAKRTNKSKMLNTLLRKLLLEE